MVRTAIKGLTTTLLELQIIKILMLEVEANKLLNRNYRKDSEANII